MHRSVVLFSLLCALAAGPTWSATKPAPDGSPGILVRNASLVVKVPDYQAARDEVIKLAGQYQAQLRQGRTEVNYLGQKHGGLTLQLDASDLDRLVDGLRKVGKLYSERVRTSDQTSLYEKLEGRIGLLRQNEGELLNFLHSPRRMRGSDILFVQYRLFQTRVEASDAAQERLDLARSSRKSLVNVELFEPEPKRGFDWRNWHALSVYRAKGAFLGSLRKLVTGLYFVLWFAPFWAPAAVVLFFVYRYVRRKVVALLAQRREQREASQAQE